MEHQPKWEYEKGYIGSPDFTLPSPLKRKQEKIKGMVQPLLERLEVFVDSLRHFPYPDVFKRWGEGAVEATDPIIKGMLGSTFSKLSRARGKPVWILLSYLFLQRAIRGRRRQLLERGFRQWLTCLFRQPPQRRVPSPQRKEVATSPFAPSPTPSFSGRDSSPSSGFGAGTAMSGSSPQPRSPRSPAFSAGASPFARISRVSTPQHISAPTTREERLSYARSVLKQHKHGEPPNLENFPQMDLSQVTAQEAPHPLTVNDLHESVNDGYDPYEKMEEVLQSESFDKLSRDEQRLTLRMMDRMTTMPQAKNSTGALPKTLCSSRRGGKLSKTELLTMKEPADVQDWGWNHSEQTTPVESKLLRPWCVLTPAASRLQCLFTLCSSLGSLLALNRLYLAPSRKNMTAYPLPTGGAAKHSTFKQTVIPLSRQEREILDNDRLYREHQRGTPYKRMKQKVSMLFGEHMEEY